MIIGNIVKVQEDKMDKMAILTIATSQNFKNGDGEYGTDYTDFLVSKERFGNVLPHLTPGKTIQVDYWVNTGEHNDQKTANRTVRSINLATPNGVSYNNEVVVGHIAAISPVDGQEFSNVSIAVGNGTDADGNDRPATFISMAINNDFIERFANNDKMKFVVGAPIVANGVLTVNYVEGKGNFFNLRNPQISLGFKKTDDASAEAEAPAEKPAKKAPAKKAAPKATEATEAPAEEIADDDLPF